MGRSFRPKGHLSACNRTRRATLVLRCTSWQPTPCKHGALPVPEGKVAVHWELVNRGERQRFRMSWRESGGPVMIKPKHWGFGRQVIQRLTAQALKAKATHEFLPGGVRWKLDSAATFVISAR